MGDRPVLIVDDNVDFANSMVLLLEQEGQPALASNSVRDALDALDANPNIGFVMADVRMPYVDGLDFARVVRHRFPRLPIALMTAFPTSVDDGVPRDLPVLRKPFRIEQVLRMVEGGPGAS